MSKRKLTHADYAEEAEAAQRADAWAQAAALWLRASQTSNNPDLAQQYVGNADACKDRVALDEKLQRIARQVLNLPTLTTRRSDQLDFHELAVWQIERALRAAYEAGRASVTK